MAMSLHGARAETATTASSGSRQRGQGIGGIRGEQIDLFAGQSERRRAGGLEAAHQRAADKTGCADDHRASGKRISFVGMV